MIETAVALLEVMKEKDSSGSLSQQLLADRIIRQLDHSTIDTFLENLAFPKNIEEVRLEGIKLYFLIKDSLLGKQAWTKANLSLTALNYGAMALCRAFPDTIVEWLTRWSTSILYTDELIRKKLFESDLAEHLSRSSLGGLAS